MVNYKFLLSILVIRSPKTFSYLITNSVLFKKARVSSKSSCFSKNTQEFGVNLLVFLKTRKSLKKIFMFF